MIQAFPPARTLLTLDINLAFMESVWVCGCSANGQEKLILFKKNYLSFISKITQNRLCEISLARKSGAKICGAN